METEDVDAVVANVGNDLGNFAREEGEIMGNGVQPDKSGRTGERQKDNGERIAGGGSHGYGEEGDQKRQNKTTPCQTECGMAPSDRHRAVGVVTKQETDAHKSDAHQLAVAALRHTGDAKSVKRLPNGEKEGEGADCGDL